MTSPRGARNRRDLGAAALAVALLAICGGVWLWLSGDARTRRDAVLAKVPDFPSPGQADAHPRRADAAGPRRKPKTPDKPAPAAAAAAPKKVDPLLAFALAPSHSVALVHVNALLNTPLYEKIKACLPDKFDALGKQSGEMGFDFERDVDRVAFLEGGWAMSGFFEGKPIAQAIAGKWPHEAQSRSYRGQTIYWAGPRAIAQIGNTLVQGSADSIESLVDRVIEPPPPAIDPNDVYGDVYWRTDLSALKGESKSGTPDAMDAVLASLSGLTVRANVWDSVALSLEGKPRDGQTASDLAHMARGALSVVREQLDQEDVEWSALAELARVQADKSDLHVDLALPASDLLERMRFPCPGREGAQPPPRQVVAPAK